MVCTGVVLYTVGVLKKRNSGPNSIKHFSAEAATMQPDIREQTFTYRKEASMTSPLIAEWSLCPNGMAVSVLKSWVRSDPKVHRFWLLLFLFHSLHVRIILSTQEKH